jgi:uroporphyrinogen decarboxylase
VTSVTPRDRIQLALQHREPDRVPWHFTFTAPARAKLEVHFGASDLDEVLGNHLAIHSVRREAGLVEVRPGFWQDEFGVVWNRTIDRDIGVVDDLLLKTRSLTNLVFPDPDNPRRYARLPSFIDANRNRFRVVSVGFSLFERAWSLRGMAELLVDMVEAPAWVDELFGAIASFQVSVVERLVQFDIDAVMFGDDWGHQHGLIMGPHHWRRFIRPHLARMYGAVKGAGKRVFIHSCGKVQEVFPELIELGLDVFNPLQPEVMDPYDTKCQYGRQLSFYGGMSVQRLLPCGTPAQIREEALRLMESVGRGGGYIIAPSHDMPGDIPLENMLAFIEAVHQQ